MGKIFYSVSHTEESIFWIFKFEYLCEFAIKIEIHLTYNLVAPKEHFNGKTEFRKIMRLSF